MGSPSRDSCPSIAVDVFALYVNGDCASEVVRMDVTVLTQLVGSLGFPIVACFYLFYLHNKSEERHKEEVERLAESLDNNTKALNKLLERLGD